MVYNESESIRRAREEEGTTTINIREELIEVVDEFKYLGSTITSRVGGKEDRGGIWAELEARKKAASKAFGMLRRSIFKNNILVLIIKFLYIK